MVKTGRPKKNPTDEDVFGDVIPEIETPVVSSGISQSLINTDESLSLGIILCDQLLFSMFYQKADLSLEPSVEQKMMFQDESDRVLLCTSRNVAKTVSLIGRVTRDIVTYQPTTKRRDDEILVFTPTESQMTPLADRIFSMTRSNILFKGLVKIWNRRSDAPKLVTKSGLTIHFRIEGAMGDDRNMVGVHPFKIYGDECAFGNWVCHRSRAGGAMPHTKWVYSGVPNGIRSTPFYNLDQTHEGDSWSRHKFSMKTANPLFSSSPTYAKEMEELFGGQFSPDYTTQVLGAWGSEAIATFSAGTISFNKTVGQPNGYKYYVARVSAGDVEKALNTNKLYELLRIPSVNPLRCVIGWDYGQSPDPSTFLIATQDADNAPWKTYARISLYGVVPPRQLDVFDYIWEFICSRKCIMASLDNKVVYHDLLDGNREARYKDHIKLTSFNSTTEIDVVTGKMITDNNKNDAIILEHRRDGKIVKDWRKYLLTEQFKRYMLNFIDNNENGTRLEMGYDVDFESELLGTIERKTETHVVYDTPKVRSNRNSPLPDQIVDAARAMIDCIMVVEADMPTASNVDYAAIMGEMGWAGNNRMGATRGQWRPPWSSR